MNVKFKAHLFIFSLFFCYNLSAQEIVKGDFKNENPQSSYVLHLTWMLPTNR